MKPSLAPLQVARALPIIGSIAVVAVLIADHRSPYVLGAGVAAIALVVGGVRLVERFFYEELRGAARYVHELAQTQVDGTSPPETPADAIYPSLYADLQVFAAAKARNESARRQGVDVLRLIVEEAPSANVVMAANGRIILANLRARELFFDGVDLTGQNFLGMLARAPEALKRAMTSEGDELLTIEDPDGEPLTYHLSKRRLELGGETVVLVTVNDLTREIGRHEIEVWKQVIRVIAHEVNNSLAPISSLASTGKLVVQGIGNGDGKDKEEKLTRVFDTVKERADHLRDFLEGYARFARLPRPNIREVELASLAARMQELWPGIQVEGDVDASPGWFDPAQIEQLLLNLLKNASEAESPREEIVLGIDGKGARWLRFVVKDRGHGMPVDVMKRALVPLFSTKAGGGGLGLALCREIAEAHGGTLRLEARDGGGVEVNVKLPRRAPTDPEARRSALTLSRGG